MSKASHAEADSKTCTSLYWDWSSYTESDARTTQLYFLARQADALESIAASLVSLSIQYHIREN